MTRFDNSPLLRTSMEVERLVRFVDTTGWRASAAADYPPYDIEKRDDDRYRVRLAVPGFDAADLDVAVRGNQLTVAGRSVSEDRDPRKLYRGIAGCGFTRTFELPEHVTVEGARLDNGVLRIDLLRELPRARRSRKIGIKKTGPQKIIEKAKKLVESVAKAA